MTLEWKKLGSERLISNDVLLTVSSTDSTTSLSLVLTSLELYERLNINAERTALSLYVAVDGNNSYLLMHQDLNGVYVTARSRGGKPMLRVRQEDWIPPVNIDKQPLAYEVIEFENKLALQITLPASFNPENLKTEDGLETEAEPTPEVPQTPKRRPRKAKIVLDEAEQSAVEEQVAVVETPPIKSIADLKLMLTGTKVKSVVGSTTLTSKEQKGLLLLITAHNKNQRVMMADLTSALGTVKGTVDDQRDAIASFSDSLEVVGLQIRVKGNEYWLDIDV